MERLEKIGFGIQYAKTKFFRNQAATRGAVVSLMSIAFVRFEFRSVIVTIKRFPDLV